MLLSAECDPNGAKAGLLRDIQPDLDWRVTQIPARISATPKMRAHAAPGILITKSISTPEIIWPAIISIAVCAAPIRLIAHDPAAMNSTPIGPPR